MRTLPLLVGLLLAIETSAESRGDMDLESAVAVCETAVEADPKN